MASLAPRDPADRLTLLIWQTPELDSFAPALKLATSNSEFWRRNIWIGKQTFSPIHRDPYHNLFCQGGSFPVSWSNIRSYQFAAVVGYKRFYIFPPKARPYLDIQTDSRGNTSRLRTKISCLHSDLPVPLARAMEMGMRADLGPGDTLFLPEGWFHAVESLGMHTSISINHWFR